MRDGLSLTDQAIAYGGGKLVQEAVRNMLGSVDRSHARGLVQGLARRDGAFVLQTVDALRGQGLSASGTLEEMALLLQQMAVVQVVPGALDAQDPEHADALACAPLLAADETQLLYSMVLHGREELNLMSDEYAALAMVMLRFLAFPSSQRPAAADAPRETRSAPLRAPAPPALSMVPMPPVAPPPAAPLVSVVAAAPAVPLAAADTTLGERWNELVKKLSQQGQLAALLLQLATQAGLNRVDASSTPQQWHLLVEREPLRSSALADKLAALLSTELGTPVQVQLHAGQPSDSPAQRDAAERARLQAQAEHTIHTDPVVLALLAQYPTARVVPGSVKATPNGLIT
jgi:DNA polymerase III subunit gamma/tau